ncbi:thiamine biosynthesis lipoprotein [Clostridium acetobutylicum]|uniref:FAD:protein FMN transferase n=1 Tax=Clostridium acetobutylicum (strain ATCC 824 / DSM 792 / JCM 1419 / IAM 19013 / LMG 5710 / NBRC 13948 / NRRL B-527 / VKM B-1787 / 2291 / W) TaxID=272562 RepID=Q97FH7_CLOAB|nr:MULTISPECIES: FAD:protein FMN transferase [Clostridium]AAK80706.1 Thiamine biosynthesis lipoprotein ApbE [Clostridium acetobutylicum ATCC 824]ADZ21807.1 Thiamine biosynthesis lipoprotein ApbE [Clostridium acetobutylicum EA 2018]AEI34481.1 thiamine biosynthesis lipoprotein ApbE [Clostridium acetobutylicum DSM 1731]AWV78880.1 FAD:protein FMN transferase [Clostridium acetobutylicum]MBC2395117.1 FAD:protein FMN transferase [Clostridium acetobutylicum]
MFKNIFFHDTSFNKILYCLGTVINLTAYGKNAETAIDESIKVLEKIDDKFSAFKTLSEVSKINRTAHNNFIKLSSEAFSLIENSIYYSRLTNGCFDPTIKPLVNLWNIGKENFRIPKESEISTSISLVNYTDIVLDKKNSSIMLKKQKQSVDLGGIAKGYAADKVKEVFTNYKVKHGIIDLGGNIFVVGKKDRSHNWNIGIQNPFSERGGYIGILNLKNKSVVTSGNYERYSIYKGKKYHHIINPKTGYPEDNEVLSVSVISDESIDGDGLSTGLYIMGVKKGIDLVNSIKGVDCIFVTKKKEVYLTNDIKSNFKISNKEFQFKEVG